MRWVLTARLAFLHASVVLLGAIDVIDAVDQRPAGSGKAASGAMAVRPYAFKLLA